MTDDWHSEWQLSLMMVDELSELQGSEGQKVSAVEIYVLQLKSIAT